MHRHRVGIDPWLPQYLSQIHAQAVLARGLVSRPHGQIDPLHGPRCLGLDLILLGIVLTTPRLILAVLQCPHANLAPLFERDGFAHQVLASLELNLGVVGSAPQLHHLRVVAMLVSEILIAVLVLAQWTLSRVGTAALILVKKAFVDPPALVPVAWLLIGQEKNQLLAGV
jgi:hypothetical protein